MILPILSILMLSFVSGIHGTSYPEPCPECTEYEKLDECPDECPPEKCCHDLFEPYVCECTVRPHDAPCRPKCICIDGYIRNNEGVCIKIDRCCDDPNAQVVDCPSPCDKDCDGNDVECDKNCPAKTCRCLPDYVKDANGKCIPKEKCPLKCLVNERLNPCPEWCTFDADCDSYVWGQVRGCTTTPSGQELECVQRCECIDGFVRINGTCLSANYCCKVVNSVVVNCPADCDKDCDGNDVANCDKDRCTHRTCRCLPGLVRDDKGNCIPKEECPKKCDVNEEYKECGPACEPTCDKRNPICAAVCTRGCFCRKGYIRNSIGKCIKISDCPPQCKPNEVLNLCPKYCTFDATCDSYLHGIIKDCPPPPHGGIPCIPRCDCKPGFVRVKGVCVSADICCNNVNAEVLDCPARCQEECFAGPTDVINCVDNCKGRVCRCKKGFLYDITKKCVAPKDCIPKLNCKANEVYNRCPKPCKPGDISYCSEYITNTPLECLPVKDFKCIPRCDCIKDYLRDKKGVCVKKENCCDDPNAIPVKCPNPCPKTCENLPTYSKLRCAKKCKPFGCTCRDGFVQDANGKCIKPEHCPKICTCANEEYRACGPSCEPSCDNRKPKVTGKCVPGCFCKKGYLRKDGECVDPSCCHD